MSRAINLKLEPEGDRGVGLQLNTYTYGYFPEIRYASMREGVCFDLSCGVMSAHSTLTPDEARVLANQLLQVADICDEHRARRESLEDIEEQLRDEDFDARLVHFHHPDVVYAEPGRMAEVAQANPGKLVIGMATDEHGVCQGGVALAGVPA